MLRGEELDELDDEKSAYELEPARQVEVAYNPEIPIEAFDFIIVDECHRSIYGIWRQVLEYFGAYLVGLTATPLMQTLGFFNQNLVMEYDHAQAVADGVNVDFDVYRIGTRITEQGSDIEASAWVSYRGRRRAQGHAQAHATPPPADQRQSGALHPDAAERVGLRSPLPLQRRTPPPTATLALLLHCPQTTRRHRRGRPRLASVNNVHGNYT